MRVIWSPDAEKELDNVIQYCLITFGYHMATKAYRQMKHYDVLLADNPLMGKVESLLERYPQSFRSIVVHEHYKLVYYIDKNEDTVYVVDIWNTRRDPASQVEKEY